MPVGPQLPPAAEKRKRSPAADDGDDSDSDVDLGPQPPKSEAEESAVKKPRVLGPSLPPEPATGSREKAEEDDTKDDDSSDDDDFGPSLPSAADNAADKGQGLNDVSRPKGSSSTAATAQSKRDDWMTLAPASGDWSQRVDPTKLKNRKFATGRSNASSTSSADAWHETPEQKQARLQREVLGIKDRRDQKEKPANVTASSSDEETARRMKEYNDQRGPSLYDAHQKSQKGEKDDDPSARAFDREKDIGGGLQLNSTQRKEMMKKSADFNSRFSSAKYL